MYVFYEMNSLSISVIACNSCVCIRCTYWRYDWLGVYHPFDFADAWSTWMRGLSIEDICLVVPRWVYCSVTVRLLGRMGVWVPGLFATTF